MDIDYFHSHTVVEVFPISSDSCSKTPTALSREDSLPVNDVRKNTEPRNLTFPGEVKFPIPCAVQAIISTSFLLIITPCPSPYNTLAARGINQ